MTARSYRASEWPYGLRCAKCSRLFIEGEPLVGAALGTTAWPQRLPISEIVCSGSRCGAGAVDDAGPADGRAASCRRFIVLAGSRVPSRERAARADTRAAALSSGERHFTRTGERLPKSSEHGQVGVQLDAGESAYAERCEAVVVLQAAVLALDGGAPPVEALPLVGVSDGAGYAV